MTKKGFTLPEIVLVVGIIAALFSLGALSLVNIQRVSVLDSSVTQFIADAREQQTKAMVGEAQGIYFAAGSYTLFVGDSYSPTNETNFVTDLDDSLAISAIGFSGDQIIFAAGSGEVDGYVSGSDDVTISDSVTTNQATLRFSQLGVPSRQ